MNAVNALLIVLIALRLMIGMALFNSARNNKLPNLYWLAMFFFLYVMLLPFGPTVGNPLGDLPIVSLWLSTTLYVAASGVLAGFVHTTFYLHKKSPVGWILGLYAVLAMVTVYGLARSESNFNQSPWVAAGNVSNLIMWAWHGWAALQALQGLAKNRTVEDWVKARYGMMVAYSASVVVGAAAGIIRVIWVGGGIDNAFGNVMALISLICNILSVGLQFLVWVMPERLRRWLNRNYRPPLTLDITNLTEEDVFKHP